MSYCWFILGNGRGRYLERTVASWEANLHGEPDYKIIFDDSGNQEYREWLNNKFGDRFIIMPISETNVGHSEAINFIFKTLQQLKVDYALEVEEDWMLNRPLRVFEIIASMKKNKHITQMRIPRTIWYEYNGHTDDIEYGSLLKQYSDIDTPTKSKGKWYEFRTTRYFWSHNPSIFPVSICNVNYPHTGIGSEYDFGISLLEENEDYTFGYWAKNLYDSYVTHIGYHDKFLRNGLPELG